MRTEILPKHTGPFFWAVVRANWLRILILALVGLAFAFSITLTGQDLDKSILVSGAAALVALIVVRAINSIVSAQISVAIAAELKKKLSLAVFKNLSFLRFSKSPGEILDRCSVDLENVASAGADFTAYFVAQSVVALSTTIYLWVYFPEGVLLVFAAALVTGLSTVLMKFSMAKLLHKLRANQMDLFKTQKNLVEGSRFLQSNGMGPKYLDRVVQGIERVSEFEKTKAIRTGLHENIGWLTRFMFVFLLTGIGAEMLTLDRSGFYWVFFAAGALSQVVWSMQQFWNFLPSYTRLKEVLLVDLESPVVPHDTDNGLRFEVQSLFVPFQYPVSAAQCLGPLNFKWQGGDYIWVKGPSGSGKTSLLEAIARVRPVFKGELRQSRDLKIAYVEQDPFFFEGESLRTNLGLEEGEIIPERLLQGLAIMDAFQSLKDGLETVVGIGARNFSKGQRIRLAILRALLSKPELLLLDEPCAGLEESLAGEILAFLKNEMNEGIVVVAEHRSAAVIGSGPNVFLDLKDRTRPSEDRPVKFI